MIVSAGRERDDLDAILASLPARVRVELDHEASRYALLDEVRRAGYEPDAPLCVGHEHDDDEH